jgi:microcystin-dependent protein
MDPFVGEIRAFAGDFAPTGWFLCQGQELDIAPYTALFSLIGNRYGGNGTTKFCLPNLQGRVMIGVGTSPSGAQYNIAQHGGIEQATISIANLPPHTHAGASPAHTHGVTVPAHTHSYDVPPHTHPLSPQCDSSSGSEADPSGKYPGQGGAYSTGHGQTMGALVTGQSTDIPGTTGPSAAVSGTSAGTAAAITIQTTGNGVPIATVPLYVAVSYIIAYEGIFPSRG